MLTEYPGRSLPACTRAAMARTWRSSWPISCWTQTVARPPRWTRRLLTCHTSRSSRRSQVPVSV